MYLAADLLSANVGLVFWITVVFTAFLLLLRKFAWRPVLAALEEREKTIASSMNRAEEALDESKRIQDSNTKARREAEQQAQQLLRKAREEAEELREREVLWTREEISALRAQAQEDIARDMETALQTLRGDVVDLAIRAAEKVVREGMDTARHRALADRFINDLVTRKGPPASYDA